MNNINKNKDNAVISRSSNPSTSATKGGSQFRSYNKSQSKPKDNFENNLTKTVINTIKEE
jgi:hypothetical protein